MARILVVDDATFIRNMLRGILTYDDDHEITEAGDGNEALAKLKEASFDLVVTDLEMPGMDGETLAFEMQRLYPRIPVVLHSGHAAIARIASEVGAAAYIMKGTRVGEVRGIFARILASL